MTRQSIPRLELLSALSLAQLVDKFKTLNGGNYHSVYWTGAMAAMFWINNQRMWEQYVQHQVDEIRNLPLKDSWQNCPGHSNPAHLPSLGLTAKDLATREMWWKGPAFLYLPEP